MMIETRPGFLIKTASHEVRFVTEFQRRRVGDTLCYSPLLETTTDWTELMEIVGKAFDICDDLVTIETRIGCKIVTWLTDEDQDMLHNIEVCVEEREHFEAEFGGRKKAVSIRFNYEKATELMFFITRMRRLQSLKQIACEAVGDAVEKDDGVDELEIPETVRVDLRQQINSQWTLRWKRKVLRKLREENHHKDEFIRKLTIKLRKKYAVKRQRYQHLSTNAQFSCEFCGLKTKSKGGLTRHKKAKH